nr:ORF6C domain-containing protein [Clostridium yunnanense]
MLVKSLTDNLAWKVQKEFVSNYFRLKEIVRADGIKVISLLHAEVGELIAATSQIENRVENLENTMTIDYSQQLILQELARSTAIEAMRGKENKAYKDSSLRSKVFSQVWKDYKEYFNVNSYRNTSRVEFMKAKEYLRNWKPQGKLLRSIEDLNNDVEKIEEGFIC